MVHIGAKVHQTCYLQQVNTIYAFTEDRVPLQIWDLLNWSNKKLALLNRLAFFEPTLSSEILK